LLGIIAYQSNKITLAVPLIHKAIDSNPNIALFHSNLGEMYRLLKNTALSIESGLRAVSLDPKLAIAWSNLGIAYYDIKAFEKAESCHQRALALNPFLGCSLNNMGSIYKEYENMKKAIEFYQEAIKSSPQLVEPYNNLGVVFLNQQEFMDALHCFRQAILLAPTFVEAHCNLGFALLHLNQIDEAQFYFEKTLQLNPNHAEAYYGISKTYLERQEFISSENYIHKAIAIDPEQVDFYQLLGSIYNERGEHLKALSYLNHAISMNSTSPSLTLSKGSIFMEMGEIAKAEEQFLKIAEHPMINIRVSAHYSLVQLQKIKTENYSLKMLLSMVNEIQNVSPDNHPYIYFALGKCFDDLGEWPQAFEYFNQGCHLKRKRISYNNSDQVQLTHRMLEFFTPKTIENLRNYANMSALPIFIVGMPRSGSTLVEQILSSHPQVYGAGELKYFNRLINHPVENSGNILRYPENLLHLSPAIYRRMLEQYLQYLRFFSYDAIRITDKMLYNFNFIGIIHTLFPNAKIIHVRRNPIDTCLSCYTKLFREAHLYSYDLIELGQYYLCYEHIMNHWRNTLPAGAWLEMDYENLIHHFEVESKRLIEYCDLTWNPACLTFYTSKRQVRTASFMQVRQPIYQSSVNRWRRFENELAPLIEILNQKGVQSTAQQQT
jgi:tetratricopeptide (TPR) repeat protein